MKKIISVLLALIMVFSMGVVALAECPGEKYDIDAGNLYPKTEWKIKDTDFTKGDFCGAHMVEEVKIDRDGKVVLSIKENFTMDEDKDIYGEVVLAYKDKSANVDDVILPVHIFVNNIVEEIYGAKKPAGADDISGYMNENTLIVMDEDGGYVMFEDGVLTGTVKMNKNEKVQAYVEVIDEDVEEKMDEVLGDFDGIVEYYNYAGTGFKNEIAFTYEAEKEDPHFFYQWNGKTFVKLDVEFDEDEDVDAYVWTGDINNTIIVTDEELVAAEVEPDYATKNPDTGANDVVGVASALAVVSLVAAGAISLKK